MTYINNLDSAFQTLWMEIQFAKKTNAVNFVKSCINYITLLNTSKITSMKPLRSKSLIDVMNYFDKNLPKADTCPHLLICERLLIFFAFLVFQWAHAYI